jgi:hypothetical protein
MHNADGRHSVHAKALCKLSAQRLQLRRHWHHILNNVQHPQTLFDSDQEQA